MHTRELGRTGEELAARYLSARGWTILDRNVRTRDGELDIVAARDDVIAFVEVKTRRSRAYGSPAEAVTHRKAVRIRLLATRYLAERTPAGRGARAATIRFDVIDILARGDTYAVTHLEGVF